MFEALNDSALHDWLNSWLWGFPAAEIFHILMTSSFFGGIAMIDLRLLGFHRGISSVVLMRHILPCLWWIFVGVIISGSILFMFMPLEYAGNPSFHIKLVLIAVGGFNALFMHVILLRNQFMWDSHGRVPFGVKLSAFLSLLIWGGVLGCGRMIAYFYGV